MKRFWNTYTILIWIVVLLLFVVAIVSCEKEEPCFADISKAQAAQEIGYDGISFHTDWSQFHWDGFMFVTAYVYDYDTELFTAIDEDFDGWIKWSVYSNAGDTTITTCPGDMNHGKFRFYNPSLPHNTTHEWINPLAQWMFEQKCNVGERLRMEIEVEGYEKQGYCGKSRVFSVVSSCPDYCETGNFDMGIWDLSTLPGGKSLDLELLREEAPDAKTLFDQYNNLIE
jgi:hypothetical protein